VKTEQSASKKNPKNVLRLPDLDQAKSAVVSSLPSKESQRGYRHAIDEFITWYCSETEVPCSGLTFCGCVGSVARPIPTPAHSLLQTDRFPEQKA
jgi:hypothetical protein